jgi:drug/metabolite transporter (DMT)-like permease
MTNPRLPAYIALIIAEVIYGSLLVVIKPALTYVTSYEFLFLRFMMALPFVLPFLIITIKRRNFPFHSLPQLLFHEIIQAINILIVFYILMNVSALQASLLITIRPVFITIAGIIFLKENEERHQIIGLILATIGATLIATGPLSSNESLTLSLGVIGLIITNIIDALITVNFKKRVSMLPKQSINLFHVVFAFIFYGLINFENIPQSITTLTTTPLVLYSVTFAGVFGSIVASILSIYGISKIDISKATLFSYIKPLVYIPLAVFWLHERVEYIQILGLLIIMIGLFIAEVKQPNHWYHRMVKRAHSQHQSTYHLRH